MPFLLAAPCGEAVHRSTFRASHALCGWERDQFLGTDCLRKDSEQMATMTKKSPKKTATKTTKTTKAVKKTFKPTTTSKQRSRSQVIGELATASELKRGTVKEIFDNLTTIIGTDLGSRGPGVFSFMGLAKFKTVKKPATKERTGVNPFTGETQVFKAKPASKKVRIRATKTLNALVS